MKSSEYMQLECEKLADYIRDEHDNDSTPPSNDHELVSFLCTKAAMFNPAILLAVEEVKSTAVASYWAGYRKGQDDERVKRLLEE